MPNSSWHDNSNSNPSRTNQAKRSNSGKLAHQSNSSGKLAHQSSSGKLAHQVNSGKSASGKLAHQQASNNDALNSMTTHLNGGQHNNNSTNTLNAAAAGPSGSASGNPAAGLPNPANLGAGLAPPTPGQGLSSSMGAMAAMSGLYPPPPASSFWPFPPPGVFGYPNLYGFPPGAGGMGMPPNFSGNVLGGPGSSSGGLGGQNQNNGGIPNIPNFPGPGGMPGPGGGPMANLASLNPALLSNPYLAGMLQQQGPNGLIQPAALIPQLQTAIQQLQIPGKGPASLGGGKGGPLGNLANLPLNFDFASGLAGLGLGPGGANLMANGQNLNLNHGMNQFGGGKQGLGGGGHGGHGHGGKQGGGGKGQNPMNRQTTFERKNTGQMSNHQSNASNNGGKGGKSNSKASKQQLKQQRSIQILQNPFDGAGNGIQIQNAVNPKRAAAPKSRAGNNRKGKSWADMTLNSFSDSNFGGSNTNLLQVLEESESPTGLNHNHWSTPNMHNPGGNLNNQSLVQIQNLSHSLPRAAPIPVESEEARKERQRGALESIFLTVQSMREVIRERDEKGHQSKDGDLESDHSGEVTAKEDEEETPLNHESLDITPQSATSLNCNGGGGGTPGPGSIKSGIVYKLSELVRSSTTNLDRTGTEGQEPGETTESAASNNLNYTVTNTTNTITNVESLSEGMIPAQPFCPEVTELVTAITQTASLNPDNDHRGSANDGKAGAGSDPIQMYLRHLKGDCHPCSFFHKGCDNGWFCRHCHFCSYERKKCYNKVYRKCDRKKNNHLNDIYLIMRTGTDQRGNNKAGGGLNSPDSGANSPHHLNQNQISSKGPTNVSMQRIRKGVEHQIKKILELEESRRKQVIQDPDQIAFREMILQGGSSNGLTEDSEIPGESSEEHLQTLAEVFGVSVEELLSIGSGEGRRGSLSDVLGLNSTQNTPNSNGSKFNLNNNLGTVTVTNSSSNLSNNKSNSFRGANTLNSNLVTDQNQSQMATNAQLTQ